MHSYEWDEQKRLSNLRKHGIDFRDVVLLEDNPMLVGPARTVNDEARWMAVGRMNSIIVTMIFTKRDEAIRIISLRSATRDERRRYQTLLEH